jgi:hypothetical protein
MAVKKGMKIIAIRLYEEKMTKDVQSLLPVRPYNKFLKIFINYVINFLLVSLLIFNG